MKENKQTKKMSLKKVLPIMSGAGFLGVSAVLIATSTGLSTQTTANNLNQSYTFDNQTFNSTQDLLEYGQANYYKGTKTVNNRYRWSIDDKGEKIYFNDPKLLREHLSKRINRYTGLSSSKFSQDLSGIGEISGNDLSKLYFNQSEDQLKTEIYRGKNNSIHKSEEAAKDSYLSLHDAYYFNNIYFKNIEDLRLYLSEKYYVPGGDGYDTANASQNIGIIGPDGIISSAINVQELFSSIEGNSLQSKKDFMDSMNNQAKKYLEFKDQSGKYFYANQEDLKNPNPELLSAFNNPSYTRIHSNQGKSTYVVDLDREDPNSLFGPYYVKSSSDLEVMTDPDQWNKIEKNDPLLSENQNVDLIANLMNLILVADESIDNNLPFNIKYLNDSHINPFYKMLKSKHSYIYNEWVDLNIQMRKGQKYNTFYNLPISFMFLLDNLIEAEAKQSTIQEVQKLFVAITEYLDYVIALLFPADLLKSTNPNTPGKTLSLTEIFSFDNNNIDWNTDIQYFISEISKNYKQFIAGIKIYSQATLNAMYNGGTIPYKNEFIEQLLGKSSGVFESSNIHLYENLWNMFSSSNMEIIKNTIVQQNSQTINSDFLDNIVIALSTTNSLFSSSAKFIFEENFKKISIGNDKYGLLDDFEKSDGVLDLNGDKLLEAKDDLSWENYMLIKFINNASSRELNQFVNFNGNQENLYVKLQSIVNKIPLKQYSINFVIEPKIVNNFFIISKSLEIGKKFINSFIGVHDWIQSNDTRLMLKESISGLSDKFNIVKNIDSKGLAKLLNDINSSPKMALFAKGIPYVQVALVAIDLINQIFIPKTSYSSYVFDKIEGSNFIWNGGQKTTMFFGLAETSSTTIDDMKLLKPWEIISSKVENKLYFDGKTYQETNLDSLKIDQLKSILNNVENLNNDNIKVVYSFDDISPLKPSAIRNDKVFDKFGDINDLIILNPNDKNYISLSQYVYNKIYYSKDGSAPEYHSKKFVFANGQAVSDINANISLIIDQVINDIRSVKIALMPILSNNKPKGIDGTNEDDGSIGEYTLPSISWNAQGFITNRTNKQYIIFDPNQELLSGKVITDREVEENIRKLFHASFDIDSKTVINNEINNNNMFSALSSSIKSNYIYEATLSNNLSKYFFSEGDAFNWLLSEENFTLYTYNTENHIYEYQGQIFNSKDEFINFILETAIKEDK